MVTHEMKLLYFVLTVYSKSFSLANNQKTTTKFSHMRPVSMCCAARSTMARNEEHMSSKWQVRSRIRFSNADTCHLRLFAFSYSNTKRPVPLSVVSRSDQTVCSVHNTRTYIVACMQSRLVVLVLSHFFM